MTKSWPERDCRQRRGFRVETRRPVECPEPSGVIFEIPRNGNLRGESGASGQSTDRFLASFSGRPQQRGLFFDQKNAGNVSHPFGLGGCAPGSASMPPRLPRPPYGLEDSTSTVPISAGWRLPWKRMKRFVHCTSSCYSHESCYKNIVSRFGSRTRSRSLGGRLMADFQWLLGSLISKHPDDFMGFLVY